MGRHAKPIEIKEIEGNRGKRTLKIDRPKPRSAPSKPTSLSKDAKPIWDRLVAGMVYGVWTSVDENLLAAYCETVAMLRKAVREIEKAGLVVEGSQGQPVISPWHRVFTDATSKIVTLGSRLGLDPIARQAIDKPEDAPDDEFAGMIQ